MSIDEPDRPGGGPGQVGGPEHPGGPWRPDGPDRPGKLGTIVGEELSPYAAQLLREAGLVARVRFAVDPALPDGGYRVDTAGDGTVTLTGEPFAGLVYAARDVVASGAPPPGRLREDAPALPLRTLWTWDHSTNWDPTRPGGQEMGALNPYQKDSDTFLADYRRLVDFASRERIGGIVVYGLLRDAHGGVDAARRLCDYANARGVRVIAGVGINAYGGVYFDGDHDFNLATRLRRRPDLAATLPGHPGFAIDDFGAMNFPASDYMMAACPSHPENLAWHRDAVDWLLSTLPVGGINFETGDYGSCACPRCTANTGGERTSWSYRAMARVYPALLDVARRPGPAGAPLRHLVEVYWDNIFDLAAQRPLADLPDDVAYQYCVNHGFWEEHRDRLTPAHVRQLPHPVNVLRTHAGSQWNRQRHALVPELFADMARRAAASGMRGLTIFAEPSAYHAANELNYLAYARFCWNPGLSFDEFWTADMVPRLGGVAQARVFRDGARVLDDPAADAAAVDTVLGQAVEVASAASDDVQRRWLWLAERASRRRYAAATES